MMPVTLILLLLVPVSPPFEEVTLAGEVVRLEAVLDSLELPADREPIAGQVVWRGEDGAIVPLLSDPASRALFVDERLRDRPIQLQGRRYAGLPYLQLTSFRVLEDGAWRVPEYYCDVCAIGVRYDQPCPCCQDPLELRFRPERP